MRGAVYTENEKKQYVSEWQQSAQSAAGYAAAKGIKESTFYKWTVNAKKASGNSGGAFVEVPIEVQPCKLRKETNGGTVSGRLFIRTKGIELEIGSETPLFRVAELLKAMVSL